MKTEENIIKEDGICPKTKQHCYDECCPTGAVCNMWNDKMVNEPQEVSNSDKSMLEQNQGYEPTCVISGKKDNLIMVAHRNDKGNMVGWLFL